MKREALFLALICGMATGMLLAIAISVILSLAWEDSILIGAGLMFYGSILGAVVYWAADVFNSRHQQG